MATITIPRVAAVGAVLGSILLVLLARAPSDVASSVSFEIAPPPAREESRPLAAPEPAAAPSESLAVAKQRELEAMSETFRNTTFLIAIRDAGFVCNELLRVSGGFDESSKWLATCSEMLSYTVGVANDGALRVAPLLQYFDGVGVRPVEQDFAVPEQPRLQLPPQPLVPQPR